MTSVPIIEQLEYYYTSKYRNLIMSLENLRMPEFGEAPDIGYEADVAVVALDMLGLVDDRVRLREVITEGFSQLVTSSGLSGNLFIKIPRSVATLTDHIHALDSKFGSHYPKCNVNEHVWTRGKAIKTPRNNYAKRLFSDYLYAKEYVTDGYASSELSNLSVFEQQESLWTTHARLAVRNVDNHGKSTLLHFTNQRYDDETEDRYAETQITQIESYRLASEEYKVTASSRFNMRPLSAQDIAFLSLMSRIKEAEVPLHNGEVMRDATLPPRTIDGFISVTEKSVGATRITDTAIEFIGSSLIAVRNYGIGLSVG